MSNLIRKLTDAIYEASEYAIPPGMVDECSAAALKVVREHFASVAERTEFAEDRHAMMCAVEELDQHSK